MEVVEVEVVVEVKRWGFEESVSGLSGEAGSQVSRHEMLEHRINRVRSAKEGTKVEERLKMAE